MVKLDVVCERSQGESGERKRREMSRFYVYIFNPDGLIKL
jgi:hypothetical protein